MSSISGALDPLVYCFTVMFPVEHPIGISEFDQGFLVGLLLGEGHFGGDGKQAQITLRMHVRHEDTFRWLEEILPGGRLYGPYFHGGRNYYQWSVRGTYLRTVLVPLIERHIDRLDSHVRGRFLSMCERYKLGSAARPESELDTTK
jgi:hypothetical protein